ncbi:MAG: hypothetical protein Q7U35_10840 [Methanobacteriaceae archaeon]|jgi:hypothetical protein|nr:hypothetical protein [Methanobacteriaceae archaeon]MDP2837014.1 hypothetical protein [Methanobacteriaceae archaeon]MDP3034814.1 hypothetical protein [Methanobacteriaceae archaeon]MDP3485794.1 hypothetical protein [Methanobacteriaceae archaeon]MDP3624437.1 hypothetical protein [Methanobacteriaceae archaeon]
MKRITKKPWFMSSSKEIKWKDRGRPITWQGWAFTIFYVILMIILVLYLPFFLNEYDIFYPLLFGLSMLPYLIVVRLTSDTDNSPSGITSAEISKMLKDKRKKG